MSLQGRPSLARSEQFWADAFNVLCCSAYLALSACLDADELIGLRTGKLSVAMRDIHAKCGELLVCLLLRGTPLRVLYQVLRARCIIEIRPINSALMSLIICPLIAGLSEWPGKHDDSPATMRTRTVAPYMRAQTPRRFLHFRKLSKNAARASPANSRAQRAQISAAAELDSIAKSTGQYLISQL